MIFFSLMLNQPFRQRLLFLSEIPLCGFLATTGIHFDLAFALVSISLPQLSLMLKFPRSIRTFCHSLTFLPVQNTHARLDLIPRLPAFAEAPCFQQLQRPNRNLPSLIESEGPGVVYHVLVTPKSHTRYSPSALRSSSQVLSYHLTGLSCAEQLLAFFPWPYAAAPQDL